MLFLLAVMGAFSLMGEPGAWALFFSAVGLPTVLFFCLILMCLAAVIDYFRNRRE
jgi:hypothetical protein